MRKYLLCCAISLLCFSCVENEEKYLEGNIKTIEVTDIKTTSAVVAGNLDIISNRNAYAYAYPYENGICYSTTSHPTTNDFKIIGKRISTNGGYIITVDNPQEGSFTASLTNLQKNTTYFVRAYSLNKFGTFYGNELNFQTLLIDSKPLSFYTLDNIMIDSSDNNVVNDPTWEEANSYCENSVLSGYTNWRLPTITELAKMFGKKEEIGGFNTYYYSSLGYPYYWSRTLGHVEDGAWGGPYYYYYAVNFNIGQQIELSSTDGGVTNRTYCRCVRDTL
ncbi:MAG: DUF1566 domain-containing protein [Bacteroidales bacterium]|nr:DUF1566 domain-containing protein [Bacteroidales bacterium]